MDAIDHYLDLGLRREAGVTTDSLDSEMVFLVAYRPRGSWRYLFRRRTFVAHVFDSFAMADRYALRLRQRDPGCRAYVQGNRPIPSPGAEALWPGTYRTARETALEVGA